MDRRDHARFPIDTRDLLARCRTPSSVMDGIIAAPYPARISHGKGIVFVAVSFMEQCERLNGRAVVCLSGYKRRSREGRGSEIIRWWRLEGGCGGLGKDGATIWIRASFSF